MTTLGVFVSRASKFVCMAGLASLLGAPSSLLAFDDIPTVTYLPAEKLVEGDAPVNTSYVLSITSPSNVGAGQTVSIAPVLAVVSAPAGVTTTQALSYVSISPSPLVFTGPGTVQTATVTCNFPVGSVAGNYKYSIATPGWAAGTTDNFAYINMILTIPQVPVPPSVVLTSPVDGTVYTYNLNGPAVSVPVQFAASAPSYAPITTVGADVSGVPITGITSTGLGTGSVSSTGTFSILIPGVYTITAHANNINGTSSASSQITVNLVAPPPTVSIATPAANSTYTYTAGGPALNVPFSFSAVSSYGGINSLSATLNGTPVSLTTTSGLGTLNASASGALSITAAGTYVFAVSATDQNGTSSANRSFTVTVASQTPPPTVTIVKPADGATYTQVAGSGPLCVSFSFTAVAGTGATISSVGASLNGSPVAVSAFGVGKNTATGTGNLSISAAGTYTLTATATSGGSTASDTATFTYVITPPPVPNITWLPPISTGKVLKGGTTVPIEFQLSDTSGGGCGGGGWGWGGGNLNDKTVKILVSEVFANGTTSTPQIFSYGGCNGYSIDCSGVYELDFASARGTHVYRIDIYRFPSGVTSQLVATKQFSTH